MDAIKRKKVVKELQNMDRFYDAECMLAGSADIAMPSYWEFAEKSFPMIVARVGVSEEEVEQVFNDGYENENC